jgi:hypothetical protein
MIEADIHDPKSHDTAAGDANFDDHPKTRPSKASRLLAARKRRSSEVVPNRRQLPPRTSQRSSSSRTVSACPKR